jgi:hypothetical protein
LRATEITVSTISVVVGAKVRKKDLSCDHHNSIGLKSGEYGDRHLPQCAIGRINRLEPGEKLWLAHEFQNSSDSQALTLHSEDHHIVGYCPRYLKNEVFELLERDPSSVILQVERVNLPPTPLQFRLLCQITALCKDDFRSFSNPEYQPLNQEDLMAAV